MRLFIAVAADEEVRVRAMETAGRLRRAGPDYRWVDPRDLHATLRFLGETPEELLPEVEAMMRRAAARTQPFEIVYGAVGAFDSLDDPRVVWIGLEDGAGDMERLAGLLERDEPRPYSPHLTLGRRRGASTPPALAAALRAEPALGLRRPVGKISLYASRPAPFGHVYEILLETELSSPV